MVTIKTSKKMNKTFKTMLVLMAGTMAFTACSRDNDFVSINEQPSPFKKMTFFASQEGQEDATRAAIDVLDIKWSAGDKISIFDGVADGSHSLAHEFTLTNGVGETSGTFEGVASDEATTYYALYPNVSSTYEERNAANDAEVAQAAGVDSEKLDSWRYCLELGWEEDVCSEMGWAGISSENQEKLLTYLKTGVSDFKITLKTGIQQNGNQFENVVIPSDQTVADGEFVDPKAMLMIAKTDDKESLKFKNVCAYIKVTPQFDCNAIAIRSNGTQNLAGTVTLNYNSGAPTTTVTANGTRDVCLKGTITAGNTYYIAVRPESLTSGFYIDFLTADKSYYYQRSTSKNTTLTRNHIIDLGEFETTGTWTVSRSAITASSPVGTIGMLDGREAMVVNLGGSKVAIATMNVDATSVDYAEGNNNATCYGGQYDAAGVNNPTATGLSRGWSAPTPNQLKDLFELSCSWRDADYTNNKAAGCVITVGASELFLPAAGYNNSRAGECGEYRSALGTTTNEWGDDYESVCYYFYKDDANLGKNWSTDRLADPCNYYSVRPFHAMPIE